MTTTQSEWIYNWSIAQAAYCCGMREVGHMERRKRGTYDVNVPHHKTSPEAMLEAARHIAGRRPILFNFVSYVPADIKKLVKAQPDALLLHEWINPGTGRKVECWMLTNNSRSPARKQKRALSAQAEVQRAPAAAV